MRGREDIAFRVDDDAGINLRNARPAAIGANERIRNDGNDRRAPACRNFFLLTSRNVRFRCDIIFINISAFRFPPVEREGTAGHQKYHRKPDAYCRNSLH